MADAAGTAPEGKGGPKPVYYGSYLHLDELLACQRPLSREAGNEAHEELLFITTHQVYELLFKQVLHELDSVRRIFQQAPVDERQMGSAVSRLQRIRAIQEPLLQMISVLETMSPGEFLTFRDQLHPASGFQSVQWRLIENKLGLQPAARLQFGYKHYCTYLQPIDSAVVRASEEEPSLFDLIEQWLERTPFLSVGDYSFWTHYQEAVARMNERDGERLAASGALITPEQYAAQLRELQSQQETFSSIFNETKHDALRKRGDRRLSYTATQAALLITLYNQEPILHLPYRLLNLLVEIDEMFALWRHRHSLMVHRMLGVKMGTGGSSGFHYLRATAERHMIFLDLFNLSTFLIPPAALPPLPRSVRDALAFSWQGTPAAAAAAVSPHQVRKRSMALAAAGEGGEQGERPAAATAAAGPVSAAAAAEGSTAGDSTGPVCPMGHSAAAAGGAAQ